MTNTNILIFAVIILIVLSCGRFEKKSDGYGNFEANDVQVSSEIPGKIVWFPFHEGEKTGSGQLICIVDTQNLYMNKLQLLAQLNMARTKITSLQKQVEVQEEQRRVINDDYQRFSKMLADSATTQRQVDDLKGKLAIADRQIESLKSQFATLHAELALIDVQIKNIELQISKCYIKSPLKGTVIEKYLEPGEMAVTGKNICKIADIDRIILRSYVGGSDLTELKTGQTVEVIVDSTNGKLRHLTGKVIWISPQAEFTPKIIQTREERVHLVYAVKVEVENDGRLKIGMPGEIIFLNRK